MKGVDNIMNTLFEVKAALKTQQQKWLDSTTIWSDFSDDFETGMRQHKEAVEYDFLTENDVVDSIESCDDNADMIDEAEVLRSDCLYDTLKSLDL